MTDLPDGARRTPMDRLRGLAGAAPGQAALGRDEPPVAAGEVAAEPPHPSPAVIAVGERPVPTADGGGSGTGGVPAGTGSGAGKPTPKRKQGSFLRELPILLAIAIVLALLIKTFLVQAFFIPSGSMEQTLHIHDRVLVNKLADHTGDPKRGDIVVFDTSGTGFADDDSETATCPPGNALTSGVRAVQRFLGIGTCGEDDYIKRVIAVPGDTIRCCTASGQVILDGKPLTESYLYFSGTPIQDTFCLAPTGSVPAGSKKVALVPGSTGPGRCADEPAITVPPGMYWVMGDHRDDSSDSRYNGFVPRDKVVGRAFVRIWPPGRIGFLRVPSAFQTVGATATGVAATPVLAAPALALPLLGGRLLRRRRSRRQAG